MISSLRGGGSEVQTLLLLKHLDRSKFEPHLYVTERAGELLDRLPADVPIHAYSDAEPARGIYYPGRAWQNQARHVGHVIATEKIDVVYDRTFHMTLIASGPCRRRGIPRVSTVVSPPHQALPLVESRFVTLKRRRLANAYRRSRVVVAVSEAVADSARRFYSLSNSQVQVIANGIDLEQVFAAAGTRVVPRDERLTLVCVGRMTAEKGQADLIDAVARCEPNWPSGVPPLRLWLIGDGPLRTDLQRRADQMCHRHQIEFLGHLTNPTPHVAAADALVLPSRFEGMPNVVLEAMALETPVIATRAGGTRELERDQPTVLWAEPAAPASLAQAIVTFTHDRQAAADRTASARRMIEQHHDTRQLTQQIETLLGDAGD